LLPPAQRRNSAFLAFLPCAILRMGHAPGNTEAKMNRFRIISWFVLLIAAGAVLGWSYGVRGKAESQFADEVSLTREEAARIQRDVVKYTDEIAPPRVSFNRALEQFGLDAATVERIATAAQHSFDFRHFRAGNKITVGRGVLGDLREVRYRIDTDRELFITPQPAENSQTASSAQISPATSSAPIAPPHQAIPSTPKSAKSPPRPKPPASPARFMARSLNP